MIWHTWLVQELMPLVHARSAFLEPIRLDQVRCSGLASFSPAVNLQGGVAGACHGMLVYNLLGLQVLQPLAYASIVRLEIIRLSQV